MHCNYVTSVIIISLRKLLPVNTVVMISRVVEQNKQSSLFGVSEKDGEGHVRIEPESVVLMLQILLYF
jgi:hypothetical protein